MNLRDRFSRALARDEIYLANHSLGRPLDQTALDVQEALDAWYETMDDAWGPWMTELSRFRASIAQIIGWDDPSFVVPKPSAGAGLRTVLNALRNPSRSADLSPHLDAGLQPGPLNVVAARGEFDSLDFILRTYESKGLINVRWIEPDDHDGGVPTYSANAFRPALPGAHLLVLSLVFFSTGQIMLSVPDLVEEAHRQGVKVLADTYHAAGVMPLNLSEAKVDFAVGGCYKYLRGGTGACWLAVDPHTKLQALDTGWFAKREPFGYHRPDPPEFGPGGDAWLESTPSILPLYQARAGLAFTLEVGLHRVREIGLDRVNRIREVFAKAGIPMHAPKDPAAWGAFGLLPHAQANELCRRIKESRVNADSRGGFVRFGPDLLTTDEEISEAAQIVARHCG